MNLSRYIRHYMKNPLVLGTFLLTASGVLSRIIGFFYRIFLSHTIGAEGIGIYQLIFPLLALCSSFTTAGIQTAISKFVAEVSDDKNESRRRCYLAAGLLLSLSLSFLCAFYLYTQADFLAYHVIHEYRTAPLLRILAYSLPFGAIHSCISGYYYGLKKSDDPVCVTAYRTDRARCQCLCHLPHPDAGTDSRDACHCGMGNCLWGDFLCSLFCRCRALFQATAL